MNSYKYVIMCGGNYKQWTVPRHLTRIHGETLISRTARLLREYGVTDIAVSTNNTVIEEYCKSIGIPVIWCPENQWVVHEPGVSTGCWCDCFSLPCKPDVCYLMGDVVFSPEAIRIIVGTETEDIEFFASAPPFAPEYNKPYAEPFAFKVHDNLHLQKAISTTRKYHRLSWFTRSPLAWEFWQVVKGTALNRIDYSNYTVINDYTCDIDEPEDALKFEEVI